MKRLALVAFLGACAFLGGWAAAHPSLALLPLSIAQRSGEGAIPKEAVALGDRFEWVAKKVSPSVVAVEAVKPARTGADKRSVEVHVANLRRKIGDDAATPRYIETVRGVGYRLAEAV